MRNIVIFRVMFFGLGVEAVVMSRAVGLVVVCVYDFLYFYLFTARGFPVSGGFAGLLRISVV